VRPRRDRCLAVRSRFEFAVDRQGNEYFAIDQAAKKLAAARRVLDAVEKRAFDVVFGLKHQGHPGKRNRRGNVSAGFAFTVPQYHLPAV
jgi:hypothetical protein